MKYKYKNINKFINSFLFLTIFYFGCCISSQHRFPTYGKNYAEDFLSDDEVYGSGKKRYHGHSEKDEFTKQERGGLYNKAIPILMSTSGNAHGRAAAVKDISIERGDYHNPSNSSRRSNDGKSNKKKKKETRRMSTLLKYSATYGLPFLARYLIRKKMGREWMPSKKTALYAGYAANTLFGGLGKKKNAISTNVAMQSSDNSSWLGMAGKLGLGAAGIYGLGSAFGSSPDSRYDIGSLEDYYN
jgi:hypothetical protein